MTKVSALEPGDHICALYSNTNELATTAAKFLAEGLKRGEQCWYVAAGNESAAVRSALRKRNVDVASETRRRALSIVNETYVAGGNFDPERTVDIFSNAIEQAITDGFTGFRAAADMSWALRLHNGAQRVIAYEALLRTLFATCKVTGLCLYHRKQMPLTVLNGALLTHPIAGIGGDLQDNPFYDPRVTTLPNDGELEIVAKLHTLEQARLGRRSS